LKIADSIRAHEDRMISFSNRTSSAINFAADLLKQSHRTILLTSGDFDLRHPRFRPRLSYRTVTPVASLSTFVWLLNVLFLVSTAGEQIYNARPSCAPSLR
jgi:hypothetical protein